MSEARVEPNRVATVGEEGQEPSPDASDQTEIDDQTMKKFDEAMPPKRGRGRPRKISLENGPADSSTRPDGNENRGGEETKKESEGSRSNDIHEADTAESLQRGDFHDYSRPSGHQNFAFIAQGVQILGEIVKSQAETQERLMQSQREFSNSVMDRMESYRKEMSRVQNESAQKEKSRLQQDYVKMSEKADEYSDENSQLKSQLEAAGRKILKLNARINSLEMQKSSLAEKLSASEKSLEDLRKEYDQAKAALSEGSPTSVKASDSTEDRTAESSCGNTGGKEADKTPDSEMDRAAVKAADDTSVRDTCKTTASTHAGWRETHRMRKMQKKRDRIVMDACSDSRFSSEQIAVIREAAREGLVPEKLQEFCRPEIPVENMKTMLAYIKKR